MDVPTTTADREATSHGAPPDWDHVPFDVNCARCGQDLHGLTDPKCPACQLEFDWSDAVPVERITCPTCDYHLYGLTELRCPECGDLFTWSQAQHLYRCRQGTLFEYRWRDRPLRSLVRTWLSLWRPKRFWKTLDLHDPPNVRALWVTWLISMLLYVGLAPLWFGTANYVRNWLWPWGARFGWWSSLTRFPGYVWDAAATRHLWTNLLPGVIWTLMSLAAMLLFRQSMRRCNVKTDHMLRVWAYAVPQMLPFALAVFILSPLPRGLWEFLGVVVFGLLVLHVVWSLRCAYRYYLHMDRAWGVAIASQIMGILAMTVVARAIRDLLM